MSQRVSQTIKMSQSVSQPIKISQRVSQTSIKCVSKLAEGPQDRSAETPSRGQEGKCREGGEREGAGSLQRIMQVRKTSSLTVT